jgi:molybdopterin converting factor small subunit
MPVQITLKLLPPYRKAGETGEFPLKLPGQSCDLRELARYLTREKPEILAFELVDRQGALTAEFMANGKHAPLDYIPADGDVITVIPYICGG